MRSDCKLIPNLETMGSQYQAKMKGTWPLFQCGETRRHCRVWTSDSNQIYWRLCLSTFSLPPFFRPHSEDSPRIKSLNNTGWEGGKWKGTGINSVAAEGAIEGSRWIKPCPWPCAAHNEGCEYTFVSSLPVSFLLDDTDALSKVKQQTSRCNTNCTVAAFLAAARW